MSTTITPQTTLVDLADLWLRQLRAEQRLDGTTIDEYERVLRNVVIPTLGATIISDLMTSMVDGLLVELGTQSLNRQRKAKVVLGAMLDIAVEVGAVPANPVRGSLSISRPAPDHRSLTKAEGRERPCSGPGMAQQGTLGAEVVRRHRRHHRGDARDWRSPRRSPRAPLG